MVLTYKRKKSFSSQISPEQKESGPSQCFPKDSALVRGITKLSVEQTREKDTDDDKQVQRRGIRWQEKTLKVSMGNPLLSSCKPTLKLIRDGGTSYKWKDGLIPSANFEGPKGSADDQEVAYVDRSLDSDLCSYQKSNNASHTETSNKFKDPLITFRRRPKKEQGHGCVNYAAFKRQLNNKNLSKEGMCSQISAGGACRERIKVESHHSVYDLNQAILTINDDSSSVTSNVRIHEDHCLSAVPLEHTPSSTDVTNSCQHDPDSNGCDNVFPTSMKLESFVRTTRNDMQYLPPSISPKTPLRDDCFSIATDMEHSVGPSSDMNLDLNMLPGDVQNPAQQDEAVVEDALDIDGSDKLPSASSLTVSLLDAHKERSGKNSHQERGKLYATCLNAHENVLRQRSDLYKDQMDQSAAVSTPFSHFPRMPGCARPSFRDIPNESLNTHASLDITIGSGQAEVVSNGRVWLYGQSLFLDTNKKASSTNVDHKSNDFINHENTWSEDELDYLWVGVRRHGKHNWAAILEDTRLHFSGGRMPEDLAKQWAWEQQKLLRSGVHVKATGSSTTNLCPSSSNNTFSLFPCGHRLKNQANYTLVDVHNKNETILPNQVLPGFWSSISSSHSAWEPFLQASERRNWQLTSADNRYCLGSCIPTLQQKYQVSSQMFDCRPNGRNPGEDVSNNRSIFYNSTGRDVLPHWLREAVYTKQFLPNATAVVPPSSSFYDKSHAVLPFTGGPASTSSPKRSRKRSRIDCRTGCLKVNAEALAHHVGSADFSWMGGNLTFSSGMTSAPNYAQMADVNPAVGLRLGLCNLNKLSGFPVFCSGSSEETISDDQSDKTY